MKYFVELAPGQDPIVVDVTELPSGQLSVTCNGAPVDVDVKTIRASRAGAGVLGSQQLSCRINGRVVDLTTEGTAPEFGIVASGKRAYVKATSERLRAAESAKKGGKGGAERLLKSPMPGRVIKIMVDVGMQVAAGQPLMIIEAMKMENDVKAKAAGVVEAVHVKLGDTVEANGKLVSFQP
jgi:biotin carboxyl carrier protein